MLSAVMEWALFPSITDRRRIAVRFGSRRGGGRRARGSLWNSRGDRCGGRRRGWLHSVSVAGDPAACHRCLPERDGLRPVGRRTEDLPIPPWWPGERGADGMGPVFRAFSVDSLRPFLESGYSVWVVTRRQNMPRGHSIEDMAVDHAAFLIVDEFDGKVDLVIGEEAYGGMIAFCLAARHPDLFDHVAVWLAGHRLSEEGKELELGFGRLMAEGRTGDAGALLVRALMPGLRVPGVDRILGAALVRMAFGTLHQYFRNDVLVEAEAVAAFDGRQILPKIQVPVLLIGCDQDLEITREIFEETAELIPDWAEPSIGGATP